MITVCIITYNQVKYIKQAIDSVLSQNIHFPLRILIADDCSTDGTIDILIKYKEQYPTLISLILQKTNVGAAQNWVDLISTPKTKYIAYLEGDDYWIDSNKLQKQVDILEANPNHSFCFTQAMRINEDASIYDIYPDCKSESLDPEMFLQIVTIHMGSVVYRRDVPINVIMHHSHGDFLMLCSLLSYGNAYCLGEVMSVYRVHENGVSYKHASLPYLKNRVNELYVEAHLKQLSKEVRCQIARIYMEHTLMMFKNYSKQISKRETLKNIFRFTRLMGPGTNFISNSRLLIRYLFM